MYKKCLFVIQIAGAAIMLLLVVCALCGTWYMLPGGQESSVRVGDNIPANILGVILACGVFWGLLWLEGKLDERKSRIFSDLAAAVAALWVLGMSLWWIFSAERLPGGDQAYIYGGASYFSQGDFSFLEPGGYCHIYPYQLGMTAMVELLYQVLPPFSYRPLQVINALAAVGIVYTGHRLVREWRKSFGAEVFYCLMISCCFPLFFYTPWVYGDILGAFFAMLAALCLTRYERCRSAEETDRLSCTERDGAIQAAGTGGLGRRYLTGMVLALTAAQLVRQSTAVTYAALALVACVDLIGRREKRRTWDKRLFASVLISVLLPALAFFGIYRIYEFRSGVEHSQGTPTVVTLAMGMQEGASGSGWDNNYQKAVYNAAVFDYGLMQEMGRAELKERLGFFLREPAYAAEFYGKKLLSQWNAPLYQSVYFTADYSVSAPPESGSLAESVSGSRFYAILGFCDRIQLVIYAGMLCWFLFAVRREHGAFRHLLAAAVIGGFFFSLLWEAKTRYILPYYIFMFPCSALGYRELLYRFCLHFRKTRDIIPM